MDFNINEVITNMADAIKNSSLQDWDIIKSDVSSFLTDRTSRLELLALMRIKGGIDDEFLMETLGDEKDLFESELHSLALISKVVAQNAANAAINVLETAIKAAIKI